MKRKLRIAILGLGKMGKNHLRNLNLIKNVEVCCLYDLNEFEVRRLSKQYKIPYATHILEALENIDAVIIATPTKEHYKHFKLCVGKVKNVFIEKPLAYSWKEASEIKKLSKKSNIFIQCGFIERYNPVVTELRKIIKQEEAIHFDFFRTNKESNRIKDVDVIRDLMIHDIDLALYLNGPIKTASVHGRKENDLVAFAMAVLIHENGCFSRLLASRITEKKNRQIQATTRSSFIKAELISQSLSVYTKSIEERSHSSAYNLSSIENVIEVVRREPLLLELISFVKNCKETPTIDYPDLESGMETIRICEMLEAEIA